MGFYVVKRIVECFMVFVAKLKYALDGFDRGLDLLKSERQMLK